MGKDPAFLFYPGDYLRDTQLLSEAAQVAYDRIMCEHMRNICITQHQVNFLTKRLDNDEREHLLTLLTKVNGGYQIEWVALSIEKRKAYSESRRQNKEGKRKKICETYVLHMENEDENEDVIKDVKEDVKESPSILYDLFSEYNQKLPACIKFTDSRRDKCRTRLKDSSFKDTFIEAVAKAQTIPALCGENDRGWKASFDWLIDNDTNVVKVIEGKYDNWGDQPQSKLQRLMAETLKDKRYE